MLARLTGRSSASILVGSIQCASSKIIGTGPERVRAVHTSPRMSTTSPLSHLRGGPDVHSPQFCGVSAMSGVGPGCVRTRRSGSGRALLRARFWPMRDSSLGWRKRGRAVPVDRRLAQISAASPGKADGTGHQYPPRDVSAGMAADDEGQCRETRAGTGNA